MLFNLQGLWWPAYISLHIDSKFVFVCGLVVFLDSQGISAGFMGFSPWCGHRCQIHLLAVQIWTQMDNILQGLVQVDWINSKFLCVQPVLKAASCSPNSPWAHHGLSGANTVAFTS